MVGGLAQCIAHADAGTLEDQKFAVARRVILVQWRSERTYFIQELLRGIVRWLIAGSKVSFPHVGTENNRWSVDRTASLRRSETVSSAIPARSSSRFAGSRTPSLDNFCLSNRAARSQFAAVLPKG